MFKPFASRRPVIRVSYPSLLVVALNARTIIYFKVLRVGGARTNATPSLFSEDGPFVLNTTFLFHANVVRVLLSLICFQSCQL